MHQTSSSQHSPASSKLNSPIHSRSGSYVQFQHSPPRSPGPQRPNLPRSHSSTSYIQQRSRRSPPHANGLSTVTSVDDAGPSRQSEDHLAHQHPTNSHRQHPHVSAAIRQSPPPVTDTAMPTGALVSPPDSTHNSSDDEDAQRKHVKSLQDLHDAVRRLDIGRGTGSPSEVPLEKELTKQESRSEIPARLSASARKISHSRSSTETSVLHSPIPTFGADGSEDEDGPSVKPPLLRKKSGELVKPAIRPKSRRKHSSMPGTPTYSKAVRFNEDIEQVRHFLQAERPIAVSAGTSPVDTYEEESEFPWGVSALKTTTSLEMKLPNFPRESHERQTQLVRVDHLSLGSDQKHLVGLVSVANIAFQKLVAVRFTFDHWRTTSEVSAEYNSASRSAIPGYDQFTFNIKLSDHGNIENKTLLMCIRYKVNGQDHWDNNAGLNYLVEFMKKVTGNSPSPSSGLTARPPRSRQASHSRRPRSMPSLDDDFSSGFDAAPPFQFKNLGSQNRSAVPDTIARKPNPTGQQFGSRYDFGASLTAALSHAQNQTSDRGNAIKPREASNVRRDAPAENPAPGRCAPRSAPRFPAASGTESPRPDALLANKQSLDSRAYQEFVSKFCFFGSNRAGESSPSPAASPMDRPASKPVLGSNDGAQDERAPYPSTNNVQKKGSCTHVERVSPPGNLLTSPSTTENNLSRSSSPADQSSSPLSFGYPYQRNGRNGFFSGSTTPHAIRS